MEENSKEFLELQFDIALKHMQYLVTKVEELDMIHDQWFLNVLDKLNEISIKH